MILNGDINLSPTSRRKRTATRRPKHELRPTTFSKSLAPLGLDTDPIMTNTIKTASPPPDHNLPTPRLLSHELLPGASQLFNWFTNKSGSALPVTKKAWSRAPHLLRALETRWSTGSGISMALPSLRLPSQWRAWVLVCLAAGGESGSNLGWSNA
jgi:hypothetical protein